MSESNLLQNNKFHKWTTFWAMYFGYALAVFNRKNFLFALPTIMKTIDLNKNDAGLISSSQNLAYTISKFWGGIFCDQINPKYLFSFGLFTSGLLTILLTAFQSPMPFVVILFLQGICQGGCWPACAKILKSWFDSSEFATWYSILNSGMNLACCIGPILVTFISLHFSWNTSFYLCGTGALLSSIFSFFVIQNNPDCSPTDLSKKAEEKKNLGNQPGRGTCFEIFGSIFAWLISISYLVIFMGRTAALDWSQLYLIHELNFSPYVGSLFISFLEIGGLFGSITSGYFADRLVSIKKQDNVEGNPRLTVTFIYTIISIVGFHCMVFTLSSSSSELYLMIVAFIIGYGLYGAISLYGVMSMEASPAHLCGTSYAFVSLAANIGAIIAGWPFSFIAKIFDWRGAFFFLEVLLILIAVAKFILRNVEYKMIPIKKKLN